jgi:hypothetical protein
VKPEPILFTFHKIREQSEQGKADAWRALLEFYAPMFFRLLEINGAMSRAEANFWAICAPCYWEQQLIS